MEHARKNLTDREIEEEDVIITVTDPEYSTPTVRNRKILMRFYFDKILQQKMLLRVIIEETADELIIVTFYKTSRSERYIKGKK